MNIPVLQLFADTGGGHRSAAQAVAAALERLLAMPPGYGVELTRACRFMPTAMAIGRSL